MVEDIQDKWSRLSLIEEENFLLELNEDGVAETQKKGDRSLVGKVYIDRLIGREVLASTLAKIWRISKLATMLECGSNSFTVTFMTHVDKQKVMDGGPWFFDNSLFVLKLFNGFSQPGKTKFDSEELWIQLHNLPLVYRNKLSLWKAD